MAFEVPRQGRNGDRGAAASPGPTAPTSERPTIGLALGGGGARGFAHIGVIRTLVAHGIMPDVIVGTSIGAVVGGCYAAGQLDIFANWASRLTRRGMLSYLDISLSGCGLIGGGQLAAQLEATLSDTAIEDSAARFATIATEVGTGHEIWLTRGRLVDAHARLLRAAGNFSAGAHRRTLAGRRRAGQSGAGVGGARARRAPGDRGQPQLRPVLGRSITIGRRQRRRQRRRARQEPAERRRGLRAMFGAEQR